MDDADEKKFSSNKILQVGNVIQLNSGFFHVTCKITKQKTGVRIDGSKSAQSREEALLLAEQYGHINS